MKKELHKNVSLKKNYNNFNKKDKSWANIFYNNLKREYKTDKVYPNFDKFLLGESKYLKNLEKKIVNYKPDLIFASIDSEDIHQLLKKFKKTKKIIWISHKINWNKLFLLKSSYDYLITDNDYLLAKSKKIKFRCLKMLISSPNFLKVNFNDFSKRSNKLYFSGSLGNDFSKRFNYLIFLSNNFKIKLRIRNLVEKFKILNYFNSIFLKIFPKTVNFLYKKKILPFTNRLKYINDDEIFGEDMLRELKKYKYCINIHSNFDQNNSINSRVFEALSCGCLLFTDENKAMKKIFKDKKHVIYFKSEKDLKNKILYYFRNLRLAYKIAKSSNKLFMKKHHSTIRLKQFKNIIKNIKL